MNDVLESGLNAKIDQEKYYMTIPIPVNELDFEGDIKIPATFRVYGVPLPKCVRKTYNYYENYYFGKNANLITSAQDTSAFRGTYQNFSSLSGQNNTNTKKSIGGSYDIFSTQVEANRGYDFSSTQDELNLYNVLKINKQSLWNRECNMHLFGYCIRRKKTWKAQDSANANKCDINDTTKQ